VRKHSVQTAAQIKQSVNQQAQFKADKIISVDATGVWSWK